MIIRAEKVQRRVIQARFLQPEINRIGSLRCSQSARTQTFIRLARVFIFIGQTSFKTSFSATLENAQSVAWLRYFPTRQRIKKRQNSFQASLFLSRLWNLNQSLRRAVRAIALAEVRVFDREAAVVVERRAPEHRTVRHHAAARARSFARVTFRTAAGFRGDTEIAGIDEAHELGALASEQWPRVFGHAKLPVVHP